MKKMKNKAMRDKSEFIRRNYTFEVRAEESEGKSIIVGRPIVYNERTDIGGWFEEVIERGALDGADLKDVRFLVNHDLSKIPLARSRKNTKNSTMQLYVDDEGMGIRVELDTENNSEARALYSAVKRGDITGMSFMFGIAEEEWENLDSDYPTRHIKKISTVVEVSAVTFPAYEGTEINARDKMAVDTARSVVETARQSEQTSVETDELKLLKLKTQILGGN